jgi:hypothetical protein
MAEVLAGRRIVVNLIGALAGDKSVIGSRMRNLLAFAEADQWTRPSHVGAATRHPAL